MAKFTGEVRIDGLAAGGEGVGRLEGRAIFVPGAFPGDVVSVTRGSLKKRWGRAEAWDLLEASPDRRESPCAWSDRCGGCDWIGYDVDAQRAAKGTIVKDALRRLGRLENVPESLDVVAAGPTLGWRRRVRLHVRQEIGFHARRTRTIVPIDRCVVADERINEALRGLRAERPPAGTVTVQIEGEGTATYRDEAPFVQANPAVNDRLVADVVAVARRRAVRFLELFAGGGNFSVPLAVAELEGVTVESHPGAVQGARDAASAAGVTDRLDIREGRAEDLLAAPDGQPDLVLLDPPRAGAKDLMASIVALRPAWIAYVSCDPGALARDLGLLQAGGYRLESVTAYDMFPHTHHVETVAWMQA